MIENNGARQVVTIILDCGHQRTQKVHVDPDQYGKNEKATCRHCGATELVSSILEKARAVAG